MYDNTYVYACPTHKCLTRRSLHHGPHLYSTHGGCRPSSSTFPSKSYCPLIITHMYVYHIMKLHLALYSTPLSSSGTLLFSAPHRSVPSLWAFSCSCSASAPATDLPHLGCQLHHAMTHQVHSLQEGGWPLGLQPLNVRVGLIRQLDSYGSISFSSLLSGSPTPSTDSSTDFDSKSTGSFFRDRSITLGSLLGISRLLGPPSGSLRAWRRDPMRGTRARGNRLAWISSLCANPRHLSGETSAERSLGYFLEAERNRTRTPVTYELDGLQPMMGSEGERNSLFANGRVAPPSAAPPPPAGTGLLCPCLRA